ncbi:MAG: hypothetical protein ACE5IH_10590 [Thermodesulfobacteriota bacterium]
MKKGILSFYIGEDCLLLLITCFLLLVIKRPVYARKDAVGEDIIKLVTPEEGSEIVAKRPLIKVVITEPFSQENLLILLDWTDMTGILEITSDGVQFRPLDVLPSGDHTLSVTLKMEDGREISKDFMFSTRHTEKFEEAYSAII